MVAERGGEMGAGGKSERADSIRIDMPFGGVKAHEAEGALRILKGGGRFGVGAGVRHAIFYEDAGDAGGVEPIADFGPFEVDGEDAVSASGKDDGGRAGGRATGRVEGKGG